VSHTCNPTWEAEIGRVAVQGQPGQKVGEIPSQPIAGLGDTMPVTPAMQEAETWRTVVQVSLGKSETLSQR
jgi:hypothetical protein